MHPKFTLIKKAILIAIAGLIYNPAGATVYTSILTGNFSSPTTWLGGNVPPVTLAGFDTVRIGFGTQVTLDQNLVLNSTTASLEIHGILSETTNTFYIALIGANMSGTGSTDLDSVYIDFAGTVNITNVFGINNLYCDDLTVGNTGTIAIRENLYVHGNVTSLNGSTITFNNNATINMNGGTLIQGTNGTIQFPISYHVRYQTGAASNSGFELSGVGANLADVEINIGTGNELYLTNDLAIHKGTLSLTSGTLVLNNNNLTIYGTSDVAAMGTGDIKSSSNSDIAIVTSTSITGALRFATGGNTVDDFMINFSNNTSSVKLGSDLRITGLVDLQSGKLNVQNHKLSLITGATVTGGNASNYIITGPGGSLAADIDAGDSLIYHIGTATHYAPCIITSKNNTVYNGMSAGVNEGVKSMGSSGTLISANQPLVNATWFLDHTPSTGVDISIELMWAATMEVNSFDRQNAYISQMIGATWNKHTPGPNGTAANGMYNIKKNNVTFLTPIAVFDATTVDVNVVAANNSIRMYPNPAKDVLHVELSKDVNAQASIRNMSGQIVNTTQLDSNNNIINISALPQGIYFIQLKGEGANGIGKFVKE